MSSLKNLFKLSEYQECKLFVQMVRYIPTANKYLFKIINEKECSPIAGRLLNLIGRRKGVSDYFLPFPCNGKHGLWIEVKTKDGKASREQADWLQEMSELGYEARLVNSGEDAYKAVKNYLCMK